MSDKIKQKTKNISTKSDYSLPKIGSSVYTISLFWFPLQENSSRAEFLFRSCPSCVQVHFRLRRSIFVFNLDFLFKFMCEFVIYFFGLSLFSCCSFFFQWHSCAAEYNFYIMLSFNWLDCSDHTTLVFNCLLLKERD